MVLLLYFFDSEAKPSKAGFESKSGLIEAKGTTTASPAWSSEWWCRRRMQMLSDDDNNIMYACHTI